MPAPHASSENRAAWNQLCTSGTASPHIAKTFRVGLERYLQAFTEQHFGPTGSSRGAKLILGMNGEGKTHLLYCLRELALEHRLAVAFLDPRTAPVGDSALVFAQEVLRRVEVRETADLDGEARVPALLRAAVARKRDAAVAAGLDPDLVLEAWAEGFRTKNLQPFGVADAVADGLLAAIRDEGDRLRDAAARLALEYVAVSKTEAETIGARLLQSLPMLARLLGFDALVILLDEAETAVERKGSAKRQSFLKFLRFLNDHVANQPDAAAMVIIGCTDDFWPDQFQEYEALRSRFFDPGRDHLAQRIDLSPKRLVRLTKVWVRETFRGDEADYTALGDALVEFAASLFPEIDSAVQRANVRQLATVASSDVVRKQVKRNFIKALCQEIDAQLADEQQRILGPKEAERALDAAVESIHESDEAA